MLGWLINLDFAGGGGVAGQVTRLAIYGGIGVPYGNFAGKTAAPASEDEKKSMFLARHLRRRRRC